MRWMLEMLLARLSRYLLCSLASFRGSAVALDMRCGVRHGIWLPGVFVESISYVGMKRSERRRKGCKENRKESEKVVRGVYTRREKVLRVWVSDDCFCILLA